MDTRKQVSLRIQQLCAAHGYNINSLARKSGIPPTTLKNIIYGNSRNPGIVTIKAAYLRKMAVDGYAVNLELPELRELVSLLRRTSNNLNQLTRRVHETGRFYDADLEELRQSFDGLWDIDKKFPILRNKIGGGLYY